MVAIVLRLIARDCSKLTYGVYECELDFTPGAIVDKLSRHLPLPTVGSLSTVRLRSLRYIRLSPAAGCLT